MMRMKVAAAAAVLGALTIPVQAGSLERNNMPVELLFEPGTCFSSLTRAHGQTCQLNPLEVQAAFLMTFRHSVLCTKQT